MSQHVFSRGGDRFAGRRSRAVAPRSSTRPDGVTSMGPAAPSSSASATECGRLPTRSPSSRRRSPTSTGAPSHLTPSRRMQTNWRRSLPMDGARLFPVSGGSEAVETALKMARAFHLARGEDRHLVIGRQGAYHGNTIATLGRGRPSQPPGAVRTLAGSRTAHDHPVRVSLPVPADSSRRLRRPPRSRTRPADRGRGPGAGRCVHRRAGGRGRAWARACHRLTTGPRSRRSAASTAFCSSPTKL